MYTMTEKRKQNDSRITNWELRAKIKELLDKGTSKAQIAREVGRSHSRVSQIIESMNS